MSTNYKIKNQDIDTIYETFDTSVANTYGVTDSKFTGTSLFKKGGADLKTAIGKVIPTSSGNHLGGSNNCQNYTVNGVPIDVALKGCRPIGILLHEINSNGTYYLNRVNGQTWLSNSANSASGTHLNYDPKYVFIELQGGGGSGAGSGLSHCSGGGGAGGYVMAGVQIPENSYLQIIVGAGAARGEAGSAGHAGGASQIKNSSGTVLAQADGGGAGKESNGGRADGGGFSGGIGIKGGYGGKKEENGGNVSSTTINLDKPETSSFNRGGFNGGAGSGNDHGGGGGASAFANGANGGKKLKPDNDGTKGSGGGGGGFKLFNRNPGSAGGCGLAKIYY